VSSPQRRKLDATAYHYLGQLCDFRVLIVSIFEGVCIAFVIIPTLIALIAFAAVSAEHPFSGFILPALTFLVTAFLAGGALTLVTIAHNTGEIVRVLQQIEKTELRTIADEVLRMEGAQRDARNLGAVSNAVLPSGNS
jgi:hypothetical protein